jgi:hypothetical protein
MDTSQFLLYCVPWGRQEGHLLEDVANNLVKLFKYLAFKKIKIKRLDLLNARSSPVAAEKGFIPVNRALCNHLGASFFSKNLLSVADSGDLDEGMLYWSHVCQYAKRLKESFRGSIRPKHESNHYGFKDYGLAIFDSFPFVPSMPFLVPQSEAMHRHPEIFGEELVDGELSLIKKRVQI